MSTLNQQRGESLPFTVFRCCSPKLLLRGEVTGAYLPRGNKVHLDPR